MCLEHSKRIFPKKDIKVYKVIMRDPFNDELCSPLYVQNWEIGVAQRTKTYDANRSTIYNLSDYENMMVGGNAFHSFKKKSDAKRYAEAIAANRNGNTSYEVVLARCTIPKESIYTYKGDVSLGGLWMDGYASQALVIDEVISKKPFNVPSNVVYV